MADLSTCAESIFCVLYGSATLRPPTDRQPTANRADSVRHYADSSAILPVLQSVQPTSWRSLPTMRTSMAPRPMHFAVPIHVPCTLTRMGGGWEHGYGPETRQSGGVLLIPTLPTFLTRSYSYALRLILCLGCITNTLQDIMAAIAQVHLKLSERPS